MVDRPILFSSPMVRALLAGRKTQTRRVCKAAEAAHLTHIVQIDVPPKPGWFGDEEGEVEFFSGYAPGDRLWVREAWRFPLDYDHLPGRDLPQMRSLVEYDAYVRKHGSRDAGRYRHARFMPHWASRLALTVTDVRVERLQDISEADAIAEGIEEVTADVAARDPSLRFWRRYRDGGWNTYVDNPIGSYASLWTELNGPGAWEANPWVVAVSLDVRRGNIDGAHND